MRCRTRIVGWNSLKEVVTLLVGVLGVMAGTVMTGTAHGDFTISGAAPQLDPGSRIRLYREDIDHRSRSLEGEMLVQADHSFSADFDGEPGFFSLALSPDQSLALAIDSGQQVSIEPSSDTAETYSVHGSPDTKILQAYEAFRKESLARLVYPPRAAVREARAAEVSDSELAALAQAEADANDAHRRELNDFTIDRVGLSPTLYATSLRWDADHRAAELRQLVASYAKFHPDLAVTRSMQSRIERMARIAIGATASPLSGTTLDDETIALEDFRGKVVLIDFWASWCMPCRIENRHYRELYESYSDRGFEIFAVNLDETRSQWESASESDGMTWPQISDLQGWTSPLATAYNVSALPASVLIDAQGRIIGRNLRGPRLAEKLESMLVEPNAAVR